MKPNSPVALLWPVQDDAAVSSTLSVWNTNSSQLNGNVVSVADGRTHVCSVERLGMKETKWQRVVSVSSHSTSNGYAITTLRHSPTPLVREVFWIATVIVTCVLNQWSNAHSIIVAVSITFLVLAKQPISPSMKTSTPACSAVLDTTVSNAKTRIYPRQWRFACVVPAPTTWAAWSTFRTSPSTENTFCVMIIQWRNLIRRSL